MRNQIEELAAEFYSNEGYFVELNVCFKPDSQRKKRGSGNEIDVFGFRPRDAKYIIVETNHNKRGNNEYKEKLTIFESLIKEKGISSKDVDVVFIDGWGKQENTALNGDLNATCLFGSITHVSLAGFYALVLDAIREFVKTRNDLGNFPMRFPLIRTLWLYDYFVRNRHIETG